MALSQPFRAIPGVGRFLFGRVPAPVFQHRRLKKAAAAPGTSPGPSVARTCLVMLHKMPPSAIAHRQTHRSLPAVINSPI